MQLHNETSSFVGVKTSTNDRNVNDWYLTSMTLAELRYGVERLNSSRFTQQDVDLFVTNLTVFAWDAEATQYYAILRADLERKGLPIGNMDMLIAAHALRLDAILVTNNQRHFSRIAGLKLENWVEM